MFKAKELTEQELLIEVREVFEWLNSEDIFDDVFNISNPLNINQWETLEKMYDLFPHPVTHGTNKKQVEQIKQVEQVESLI